MNEIDRYASEKVSALAHTHTHARARAHTHTHKLKHKHTQVNKMLVGNKCDLTTKKAVDYNTAKEFADQHRCVGMLSQ